MSDNWDFYFCTVENCPASIFVDLGLREFVPILELPDMVFLRLYMNHARTDGLSSDSEYDVLNAVEQNLEQAVAADFLAVYVGRNTTAGFRDFAFYAKDGAACEQRLRRTMPLYPNYRFESGYRNDSSWDVYLNFLYPTRHAMQEIQNRKVYASLEQNGDTLTEIREIDHWAYFSDSAARQMFVRDCEKEGFSVRAFHESQESGDRFGVQVYRADRPRPEEFDSVTVMLVKFAEEHGGDYDGWETQARIFPRS